MGRSSSGKRDEKLPLLVLRNSDDENEETRGYGTTRRSRDRSMRDPNRQPRPPPTKKSTQRKGILSFASKFDILLMVFGTVASVFHGAGFPLLSIAVGGMTNVFLRAQNSPFVLRNQSIVPEPASSAMPPISQEEFDEQVVYFCYFYLILGVLMFVTSYVQIACWETVAERIVHNLRQHYLKAILRQEIAWFDTQQTGELTSRLTDDLERVREGLGDKLSLFIQMAAGFAAGFGVGFYYNWQMTLVMAAFAPLVIISGSLMSKIMAGRQAIEQKQYAIAGSIADEVFSSIRTVQAMTGEEHDLARFDKALADGYRSGIVKYLYMGLCVGFGFFCTYASYSVSFWFASTLVANDPAFDRGSIFTVFFAVMNGSTALGGALPQLALIAMAFGAARAALRVINSEPTIDPYSSDGIFLPNVQGAIELKDVHFTYPSRPDIPILRGVSMSVTAGQKIALVGASGCGKSTIVNLLLRFYDPLRGKLTLDGCDLKALNVQALRESIGIVSQEPVLFDGTLYDNIKTGKVEATNREIIAACKIANAYDFIRRLPEGLATRVGERGVQLSGGQKQRIAIARALVKNPRILLLDEATSALDSESESTVQQALERAMTDRTTIIVAHRLATIRNCDRIYVFREGVIVEEGTYEELLSSRGVFFDMTQAQKLRDKPTSTPNSEEANGEDEAKNEEADDDEEGKSASERKVSSRQLEKRCMSPKPAAPSEVASHTSTLRKYSSAVTPRRRPQRKTTSASMVSSVSSIRSLQVEAQELKTAPTPLWKIMTFNRDRWHFLFFGLLGSFVNGAITPLFALIYAQIFNVFSEPVDQMRADALFWSGMFLALGIASSLGFFTSANMLGRCGESLTRKLRFTAFRNIIRQDIAFFDDEKHGTGKLCTRLATDVPNVRYVFTRLPAVVSSVVTVLGALAIGFVFGWKLALVLIAIVPLIVGSGYFEMKMQFGKKMRDTELLEEAGKVATEAVQHIRTVQALCRQDKFNFLYQEFLREPYRQNLCAAHSYGAVFAFSQSVIFFMYALAFWLGSAFVDDGSMQPTDVYRVFFAIAFCGQAVGQISSFIPDVVKARLAASLLFYLIEHPTEIDALSAEGMQKKIRGRVDLRNIHFTYPTRPGTKILEGLTLDVREGQTVALVGQSGCGKSTVISLLERFYNPSRGLVLIDGENSKNYNLRFLRQQISIVAQEPTLFDTTIRENIEYGLEAPLTHEKMVQAAKSANIHDFILGLPMGYETRVGEKGTQLSGGQKQRIAIARALARDPAVLLLDEATSALDTESERVVQEALENARRGRTCLVIAHRLSTVQNADAIAVIAGGKLADLGTHDELLLRCDLYRRLVETQKLLTEEDEDAEKE